MNDKPRAVVIVVMGVAGSGKTTLGRALAAHLGLPFHDADDFHPAGNRAKLQANVPLDDTDRAPWLALLADAIVTWSAAGGAVLACSALKERYRDVLRSGGTPVVFVHSVIDRTSARRRLEARRHAHDLVRDFDRILDGQFHDLEPPSDAITVDAELPTDVAVQTVAQRIRAMISQWH